MKTNNQTLQWLYNGDPSIRWQVMRDIEQISPKDIKSERTKVATEGRGAAILGSQASNGTWGPDNRFPEMITLSTLYLLNDMGLDPNNEVVKQMIAKVQKNVLWLMNIEKDELPKDEDISWWRNPFFVGEVEPCINGRVLKVGAYFGLDMQPLVERLLDEQMTDGGWNCDQERGSTRSSFHTTINVLEGLLEFEMVRGNSHAVTTARKEGEEYLLKRHLFKRLSTGKAIDKDRKGGLSWTEFSYPPGWHYDILRGLDYLRKARIKPDPRMAEAIEIVKSKQNNDGLWSLGNIYEEEPIVELGVREGEPSRWNTLRALRILKWYSN